MSNGAGALTGVESPIRSRERLRVGCIALGSRVSELRRLPEKMVGLAATDSWLVSLSPLEVEHLRTLVLATLARRGSLSLGIHVMVKKNKEF